MDRRFTERSQAGLTGRTDAARARPPKAKSWYCYGDTKSSR